MAYQLAAYDASGRRYWNSETVDFTMAPAPVGAWITASLTVMASYPCPCPVPGPSIDSLGAWWRADDAGTVNGAAVTTWAERSGSGAVLTVKPGSNAPTWIQSLATINNQPAVNFAGGDLLHQLLPPGFFGGNNAVTLYIVYDQDVLTNCAIFFYGVTVPGGPGSWLYFISSQTSNFVGSDILGTAYTTAPSLAPRILSCRAETGQTWNNSKLIVNGAEVASTQPVAGFSLNIPVPIQRVEMGDQYQGKIAEVLYYFKAQDGNERAQTLLYLSERYNIPLV